MRNTESKVRYRILYETRPQWQGRAGEGGADAGGAPAPGEAIGGDEDASADDEHRDVLRRRRLARKYKRKLKATHRRYEDLRAKCAAGHTLERERPVLCAFVTFNELIARAAVVDLYGPSTNLPPLLHRCLRRCRRRAPPLPEEGAAGGADAGGAQQPRCCSPCSER